MYYITIDKIKEDLKKTRVFKGRRSLYLQFLGIFFSLFLIIGGFYLIAVLLGIADLDNLIISLK